MAKHKDCQVACKEVGIVLKTFTVSAELLALCMCFKKSNSHMTKTVFVYAFHRQWPPRNHGMKKYQH